MSTPDPRAADQTAETNALAQHAADVATSCAECGVTAMFCAKSLAGSCCEVCNHTERIVTLVRRAWEAEAAASHISAVLSRAVPDEDAQTALWRDHWRDQLAARQRTSPSATSPGYCTGCDWGCSSCLAEEIGS